MESADFEWVVMAIRIQREVGGNLSELLLKVATTMRERDYLRRQVKTLSAEGQDVGVHTWGSSARDARVHDGEQPHLPLSHVHYIHWGG